MADRTKTSTMARTSSVFLAAALAAAVMLPDGGGPPQALAAETVTLGINPGSQSVTAGQEATLEVLVNSGSQLVDGVQIKLQFPPALTEVVDADSARSGVQIQPGPGFPTVLQNAANNSAGTLDFAAGTAITGGEAQFGTFVAATVRFRSKAEGSASIQMLSETKATSGGNVLPTQLQNGIILIGSSGVPPPSPPPAPAPVQRAKAPMVVGPAGAVVAQDMAPLLRWQQEAGITQFHLQLIPYNQDGPGINLIISDATQVSRAQYQVLAPNMQAGSDFVMLPGMSYRWQVRVSNSTQGLTEGSSEWSAWAQGDFRTPAPSSAGINRVAPANGAVAESLTPKLTWMNSDNRVFYYEVQLSKDIEFTTDPARATTSVYWELLHGGVSRPANTYSVNPQFPLEVASAYYWRVRPRVQGDGAPVAWSTTWSFKTP